jgi:hypothetical protein
LAAASDEVWQRRDDWLTWNGKPAAEIAAQTKLKPYERGNPTRFRLSERLLAFLGTL